MKYFQKALLTVCTFLLVFSGSAHASLLSDNIHPRLWVTPDKLTKLIAARETNTIQWQQLHEYVERIKNMTPANLMLLPRVRTYPLLISWLVYRGTADEAAHAELRDKLLEVVNAYISNGSISTSDIKVENACILFDMMYNDMTPVQREGLANAILKSITDNRWETYHLTADFEIHGMYRGLRPIGAAALALMGTPGDMTCDGCTVSTIDEKAMVYLNNAIVQRWQGSILPAMNILGKGGGLPNVQYLPGGFTCAISFATQYKNSTGIDIMAQTPWFEDRIKSLLFETTPENYVYGSAQRNLPHFNAFGDTTRYARGSLRRIEEDSFMLTDHYPNLPESAQLMYFWNTTYSTYMEEAGEVGTRFTFYNTQITPVAPSKLAHYAEGTGRVSIRSGWDADQTVSSTATHITFQAGDKFYSHQALDAGTFTIFKYGDLAPIAGTYDGGGTTRSSYMDFNSTLMGQNCILIFDPDEEFKKYSFDLSVVNYGGQRSYFMKREYSVENWQANYDKMNLAKILSYEHDDQLLTYVSADITPAYNSTRFTDPNQSAKVSWVSRDFIYLRPSEYIVMLDKITATDATFEKSFLIHTRGEPTVDGTHTIIEENGSRTGGIYHYDSSDYAYTDYNGGRLFVDPVFPTTTRIKKIGGEEYFKYTGFKVPVMATYVNDHEFTVEGNRYLDIGRGRVVKADCGVDGIKIGWIEERVYDDASDKTTITLYESGDAFYPEESTVPITANLSSITFGFKSSSLAGGSNPMRECIPELDNYDHPCVYTEWRLEIENKEQHAQDSFLTVMLPTSTATATLPDRVGLDAASGNASQNVIGVHIKDNTENQIVVFSSSHDNAAITSEITYTIDASMKSRHTLMDLQPNTKYIVKVNGATISTTGLKEDGSDINLISTNAGVLIFSPSLTGSLEINVRADASVGEYPASPSEAYSANIMPDPENMKVIRWEKSSDDGEGKNNVDQYKIYISTHEDSGFAEISGIAVNADGDLNNNGYMSLVKLSEHGFEKSVNYYFRISAVNSETKESRLVKVSDSDVVLDKFLNVVIKSFKF